MNNDFPANSNLLPHQERVNLEIFRAIETLGRKIERAEEDHVQQTRRLALIESSATLDKKTGKFSLPVALDTLPPRASAPAAKWPVMATLANTAIALFTLGVVLFQQTPVSSQILTPRQIAALNSLANRDFARLEETGWKKASDAEVLASVSPSAPPREETTTQLEESDMSPPPMAPAEHVAASEKAEERPAPPPAEEPVKLAKQEDVSDKTPAPADEAVMDITVTAASSDSQPAEPVEEAPREVVKAATPVEAKEVVVASAAPVETLPVVDRVAPDPGLPSRLAKLEERAFEGVPEAQHDLATLYASGKVVAQDYKRAAYWFNKAAEAGVANADYNLGVMFQQGLGVQQDVRKALSWYARAAELGHPEAMYNLGIAYIEGVGAPKDIQKGVAYFKNAANAGVAQAAFNLGVLHESSFLGSPDPAKAMEWYQIAANQNHAEGEASVRRLKAQFAQAEDDEADEPVADNADNGEQSLTVADLVEPAAEETGEGDSSPVDPSEMPPPAFRGGVLSKIQAALVREGLLPGGSDTGAFDPPTSDAIRVWQQKNGMTADGQPSEELLEKMTK